MMNRRNFLKGSLIGLGVAALPSIGFAKSGSSYGHVVVIGAGFAGATAAKYLQLWSNNRVRVTLIEPRPHFVSCPVSNRVFSGAIDMRDIIHSYEHLQNKSGIRMIQGMVSYIDAERRTVEVNGERVSYDRLILSTGIDFDYSSLPNVTQEIQAAMIPHAWKAGPQTLLLKSQLEVMEDGGVVAITVPPVPYRCPPGPYERACQIAFYLKRHKPRSKLLILDANPAITSKRPLFERAWKDLYSDIIEYQPSSGIEQLEIKTLSIKTTFDRYKVDVLNLIPPQTASRLALDTGLASRGRGWCKVNYLNYESTNISGIHVLGDSVDTALPKSAHIANSEAKVCAAAIIAELSGEAVDQQPVFANTCYSFVDDKQAMHVANVYRYDAKDGEMHAELGGGTSAIPSLEEGTQADVWAKNIWADVLA